MPEPVLRVSDDIAAAAAEDIAGWLAEDVAARGVASLVLSGGGTPLALYRVMAAPPFAGRIPWSETHIFWGDERLVPPEDPDSNYRAAWEALLRRVPIPPANIHRMRGELAPEAAAADYTRQLRNWTAAHDPQTPDGWPRFSVVLLGLGEDGHTASLFPGSPEEAQEPVIAVTADYQGRPANRITLTPAIINRGRRVAFLVSGAGKAAAVFDTFKTPDPARFPAQRIRPEGAGPVWYLDPPAAQRLGRV